MTSVQKVEEIADDFWASGHPEKVRTTSVKGPVEQGAEKTLELRIRKCSWLAAADPIRLVQPSQLG
jgi:hypothetical protein